MNFGEPSTISKQTPIVQSAIDSTTTSSQSTNTNDMCSNVDGYCMSKYGMSSGGAYNSCVQNIMYTCNPELKNTQWSDNTCSRLQQELTEIRVMKELSNYDYNSLMQKEFDLSEDILYHCD
jgi:hypothetical protein